MSNVVAFPVRPRPNAEMSATQERLLAAHKAKTINAHELLAFTLRLQNANGDRGSPELLQEACVSITQDLKNLAQR